MICPDEWGAQDVSQAERDEPVRQPRVHARCIVVPCGQQGETGGFRRGARDVLPVREPRDGFVGGLALAETPVARI